MPATRLVLQRASPGGARTSSASCRRNRAADLPPADRLNCRPSTDPVLLRYESAPSPTPHRTRAVRPPTRLPPGAAHRSRRRRRATSTVPGPHDQDAPPLSRSPRRRLPPRSRPATSSSMPTSTASSPPPGPGRSARTATATAGGGPVARFRRWRRVAAGPPGRAVHPVPARPGLAGQPAVLNGPQPVWPGRNRRVGRPRTSKGAGHRPWTRTARPTPYEEDHPA